MYSDDNSDDLSVLGDEEETIHLMKDSFPGILLAACVSARLRAPRAYQTLPASEKNPVRDTRVKKCGR